VQTLEPLAQARGLPVEPAAALAEGAPVTDTLVLVRDLAVDGRATLCTHGDMIDHLVDELVGRRVEIVSPGQIELVKESILVLEVTPEGNPVEARYVPPGEFGTLRDVAPSEKLGRR
jgi:hypothetical protein